MKVSSALSPVAVVIASAFTSLAYGACHADNWARAVTGTRLGPEHVSSASKDCVSYFAATATFTLPGNTSTVTSVVVTTLTISNRQVGIVTKHIPEYASECKDAAQYFSACSCGFGITGAGGIHTITGLNSTVTVIQTSTTTTTTFSGTPTCAADIFIDPLNCGKCGHVCNSGKCQNGACGSTQCASNQTCDGGFKTCGAPNCFCFSDTTGAGFCGINAVCFNSTACDTDKDCKIGSICAKETCCSPPSDDKPGICLIGECSNPSSQLVLLSRAQPASSRDGTAAHIVGRDRHEHSGPRPFYH